MGHDVQNRLNRLLNAEAANVNRTVAPPSARSGPSSGWPSYGAAGRAVAGLRAVAEARRAHPEADLEALAGELGLGRSAVHHRLRRIEQLAG